MVQYNRLHLELSSECSEDCKHYPFCTFDKFLQRDTRMHNETSIQQLEQSHQAIGCDVFDVIR
jgi:hypothetical protein